MCCGLGLTIFFPDPFGVKKSITYFASLRSSFGPPFPPEALFFRMQRNRPVMAGGNLKEGKPGDRSGVSMT